MRVISDRQYFEKITYSKENPEEIEQELVGQNILGWGTFSSCAEMEERGIEDLYLPDNGQPTILAPKGFSSLAEFFDGLEKEGKVK